MSKSVDHLIGLAYDQGKQDCYECARSYYRLWGIKLPSLARPNNFWEDPALDLYNLYQRFGFQAVREEDPQEGDAVLMPVFTQMNCHAGVIVGDNQMLHHRPQQLSRIEALRPNWLKRVTVLLRHPSITTQRQVTIPTVHLHEVLDAALFRDPSFQAAIAVAMGSNT